MTKKAPEKRHSKKITILVLLLILAVLAVLAGLFGKKLKRRIQMGDNWYVTSYADVDDNQAMFYSIYNAAQDKLILVDGGWTADADQVRSVIDAYGGHVDLWIITHYHSDHVGAFNAIMANPGDITVDRIICSPIDYDKYLAVANDWDEPEYYTAFREITAGLDNVYAIEKENLPETISVGDLDFVFYSTYDEDLLALGNDLPNDGGLMFKVNGPTESMLFCSDINSPGVTEELAARWGDALDADYLQAPHHGNSYTSIDFFNLVSPKYIFFDGPQWLMEGEEYKARELVAYCEYYGIEYGSYVTAPNTILLK